jgi:hypothetical protein
MLAILASRCDHTAAALVARWAAHDSALLTCRDISTPGWRHQPEFPTRGTAVIGGRAVSVRELTAVLVRLPYVWVAELEHIAPAEREYVAAEMTAFLVSWLSGLPCPVVNAPVPPCLAGPNWRRAKWIQKAAQLGIPVPGIELYEGFGNPIVPAGSGARTVTVVGQRCFGAQDETLAAQSRLLASAAGTELLRVHFGTQEAAGCFLGADPFPDLSVPQVADAVLERLTTGAQC